MSAQNNAIKVIMALQRAMGAYPNFRVGQVLDGALSIWMMSGDDLETVEDEKLATLIDEFVEENRR